MNEFLDSVLNLKAPALLLLILNAVGFGLKKIPQFPDWAIPLALPLAGAAIYPCIGEWSQVVKAAHIPWVMMALYGFGIGWAAVGANQAMRQFLSRNEPAAKEETKQP